MIPNFPFSTFRAYGRLPDKLKKGTSILGRAFVKMKFHPLNLYIYKINKFLKFKEITGVFSFWKISECVSSQYRLKIVVGKYFISDRFQFERECIKILLTFQKGFLNWFFPSTKAHYVINAKINLLFLYRPVVELANVAQKILVGNLAKKYKGFCCQRIFYLVRPESHAEKASVKQPSSIRFITKLVKKSNCFGRVGIYHI
jgi:hypothetical protein